ncbi:hypothetical protein CPC08DRAFT_343657 [Agrocybe pediades]|nr:hypothetical protein CPC08DRAFT_343657 [Agrocybe pediades]
MSTNNEAPSGRRGRGRPKGSKNGPNAGAVGRPRKDGQPPRNRSGTNRSGTIHVAENSESNLSVTESAKTSRAVSLAGLGRSQSVVSHEAHATDAEVRAQGEPNTGESAPSNPFDTETNTEVERSFASTVKGKQKAVDTNTVVEDAEFEGCEVPIEITGMASRIEDIELENTGAVVGRQTFSKRPKAVTTR